MFEETNIIAGLEIGTSKICVVVGEQKADGSLNIIGIWRADRWRRPRYQRPGLWFEDLTAPRREIETATWLGLD